MAQNDLPRLQRAVTMWQLVLATLGLALSVIGPVVGYGVGLGTRITHIEDWEIGHQMVQDEQRRAIAATLELNRDRIAEIGRRQIDVLQRLGRIEGKLDGRGH